MKKIDCHIHLFSHICGIGSEGELRYLGNGICEYASGRKFKMLPDGIDYVDSKIITDLFNSHDVQYGICLQGNYLGFQNNFTIEECKKVNNLLPAVTYDPFFRKKELIIKHFFEEENIKILKLEVSNGSGLMANHNTVILNNNIMDEVYQTCSKYNLKLFIDIGRPNNNCYQIDNLVSICKKYSNITFIICHLTAPSLNMYELLKINLTKLNLDNVYFDIASLPNNTKEEYPFIQAQQYIKLAIDTVGVNKILWGSDFPCAMSKNSYLNSYKYIEDSSILSTYEKERILYYNSKELFKL